MGNNLALSQANTQLNRRFVGVILVILTLILFAIAAGFISGRFYFGVKRPEQKVQLTYQVCGNDIIQEHNSLNFPLDKEDKAAMTVMVKKITATSGYADDPTCQAILFSAASENDDIDGMRKSLSVLEKLNAKGKSVDGNLRNTYSTDVMRTSIEETINEKNSGSNR